MSKNRYSARTDKNEAEIVAALRKLGFSVKTGMDDILVGSRGITFWYEIKSKRAVSKKTGKVLESGIKKSQKRLRSDFKGHYRIVSSLEQILDDMRETFNKLGI